jgi:hypothetical protein
VKENSHQEDISYDFPLKVLYMIREPQGEDDVGDKQ